MGWIIAGVVVVVLLAVAAVVDFADRKRGGRMIARSGLSASRRDDVTPTPQTQSANEGFIYVFGG